MLQTRGKKLKQGQKQALLTGVVALSLGTVGMTTVAHAATPDENADKPDQTDVGTSETQAATVKLKTVSSGTDVKPANGAEEETDQADVKSEPDGTSDVNDNSVNNHNGNGDPVSTSNDRDSSQSNDHANGRDVSGAQDKSQGAEKLATPVTDKKSVSESKLVTDEANPKAVTAPVVGTLDKMVVKANASVMPVAMSASVPGVSVQAGVAATDTVSHVTDEVAPVDAVTPETTIASGTFGTSQWTLDQAGTLHFGAGTFGSVRPVTDFPGGPMGYLPAKLVDQVKKIQIDGIVNLAQDSSSIFSALPELVSVENMGNLKTTGPTSLNSLFADDSKLVSIDSTNFDTKDVTNMMSMFSEDSALTTVDTSNWDTSNVTEMSFMFSGDSALKSLDTSGWDTGKVTSFHWMFQRDRSLETLDVSNWDTSSVTSLENMFDGAVSLKALDVSKWDVSKVTNMVGVFYDVRVPKLDISKWDVRQVTAFDYMFTDCKTPASSFDFSKWNTASATSMGSMFSWAFDDSAGINLGSFDTSHVVAMTYMFYGFQGTSLNLKSFDTSQGPSMGGLFAHSNVRALDLSNFDTSNVTDISYMFSEMPNLRKLNVRSFNTSKVTNMEGLMWRDRLESLDLSSFDMGAVTNMKGMLQGTILAEIKLGKHTRLKVADSSSRLPAPTTLSDYSTQVDGFSGKWLYENESSAISSADLINDYDGTKPGTYSAEAQIRIRHYYCSSQGAPLSFSSRYVYGRQGAMTTLSPDKVDGYTFKNVYSEDVFDLSEDADGNVQVPFGTDKDVTVTFEYWKNPVKGGDVAVNLVDPDGKTVQTLTLSGNVDDTANIVLPDNGYQHDDHYLDDPAQVTFTKDPQTVTYHVRATTYSVTITYQTADETVVGTQRLTGKYGARVPIPAPKGYTIDAGQPTTVTIGEADQAVSIKVTKIRQPSTGGNTGSGVDTPTPQATGTITIHYVTSDGTAVPDATIKGPVGTIGQVPIPNGYQAADSDQTAVPFTSEPQTVTVRLNKLASPVKVPTKTAGLADNVAAQKVPAVVTAQQPVQKLSVGGAAAKIEAAGVKQSAKKTVQTGSRHSAGQPIVVHHQTAVKSAEKSTTTLPQTNERRTAAAELGITLLAVVGSLLGYGWLQRRKQR